MKPLFLALSFLLAACGTQPGAARADPSYCSQRVFEGSRFTVCDPKGGELRLIAAQRNAPAIRSFRELMRHVETSRVAFAMNAGMFDENGRPIGLAVSDSREVHPLNARAKGPGNFYMMPNGVFMVLRNGRSAIVRSNFVPKSARPRLATQSGPMLVIGGKLHPAFERDGTSRYIRNGVGVTAGGKPLFVISQDPVSFGKMARFFRDVLKTPNALFFDGAVSSLWDPANGRMDGHSPLGPIIVAFKASESAPGREARARP